MIKYIISIADVHIPSFKGIDDVEEVLNNFIAQCKEIVEREGKDSVRIVICGDIVHNKISVTNENLLSVNKFFSELDKICKTIVVAGNHDMLMNNLDRVDSITPLFEIGDFKNIVYLDRELGYSSGQYVDDNVIWCLYSSFSGFSTPFMGQKKQKDKTYVGLVHADVNGATTALKHVTENGIDPKLFKGCDFVIAGHIHKFQEIKYKDIKIVYCSSLKQREFGETVSKHGFVLWDLSDKSYVFVETPNPEQGFYKFSINDIEDIENDEEVFLNP